MKEAAATPLVHERTDHGRLTKVVLICNRLARLGLTIFKQSQRSRLLEDRPLAFTAGSHKSKKYSYQQIDRSPTVMRQVGQKNGVWEVTIPSRFLEICTHWITSPDANLFETRVILTFTWSPGLVFGTKTTRPSTRAMPSPRLLISLMSTSYSLPSSTGLGPNRLPPPKPPLLPPLLS